MKSIFFRFPILLFILAAFILANDIFHFAPGQINSGFTRWAVPGVLILFGVMALINKRNEKRRAGEINNQNSNQ